MKDHVAVLVPCYNESKTIEKVVRDFKRVLPEATVYVYDNNSSDGTGEIAARAGAVVRRERMQGKGSVIRRMFREIDADCYLMVDGDDTYPAEDAPAMVSAVLDEQADMVVATDCPAPISPKTSGRFTIWATALFARALTICSAATSRIL